MQLPLDAVLGPHGALEQSNPAFRARPQQRAMAQSVSQALIDGGTWLIEAGTGTGKTLAYLVPAVLSEKKVIISTATKTLQDQILKHDIPLLAKALGKPIAAASMKGLNNYLCLRRFEEFASHPDSMSPEFGTDLVKLRAWRNETTSGDRNEQSKLAAHAPIWSHVQSSPDTRIGPRCQYYNDCFVTHMRDAADAARILVINHHLFFADLATAAPGAPGIIPEYDAIIFDEAHHLEDIATDFLGTQISLHRLGVLARDAERALQSQPKADAAKARIAEVTSKSENFFLQLAAKAPMETGRTPLPPLTTDKSIEAAAFGLDAALEALSAWCQREAEAAEAPLLIARRAQKVRDDLAEMIDGAGTDRVLWLERHARTVSIGVSPIHIADTFSRHLAERTQSAIFTSATLTTNNAFDFIQSRLGLDEETQTQLLDSPFDYPNQAALFVPKSLPEPRDPLYLAAAAQTIIDLVELTEGGAFVLCTSHRALKEFSHHCRERLANPILVQGEASNTVLIERFRNQPNAVLFGAASFWEGVDIPGHALRLVIIDKLPFEVPTDPVVAARCAKLEAVNGSPFMDYLVPAAALALKQGFGRLIRSHNDRGIVAILDTRITTKSYGRQFLRSLPPAKLHRDLSTVTDFYQTIVSTQANVTSPRARVSETSALS